jgi:SAM-dependent methyltransferase
VTGYDRSERFLSSARERAAARNLTWANFESLDLNDADLPLADAQGAWCRWVFAFLPRPETLLISLQKALRPGGRIAIHEYFDYGTWRFNPVSPAFERFVSAVMQSWRSAGGEPDIGLQLPALLEKTGFNVQSIRPIVHVTSNRDFMAEWPLAFVMTNLPLLVAAGLLSEDDARETKRTAHSFRGDPNALMVTPAVVEIIATRQ